MVTASDVAKYILKRSEVAEHEDAVSNLKLQKLLYYAQGFHLAAFDEPLFDENVVAWEHGPVVVSVYHDYKDYGSGSIKVPLEAPVDKFNDEILDLIDEVCDVYGQYSAWKLRELTHAEPPWKDTKKNHTITHDKMRNYFTTQLAS